MAEQNTKKESTFAEKFGKKKTFTSTQVDKNNGTDQAKDESKIRELKLKPFINLKAIRK